MVDGVSLGSYAGEDAEIPEMRGISACSRKFGVNVGPPIVHLLRHAINIAKRRQKPAVMLISTVSTTPVVHPRATLLPSIPVYKTQNLVKLNLDGSWWSMYRRIDYNGQLLYATVP